MSDATLAGASNAVRGRLRPVDQVPRVAHTHRQRQPATELVSGWDNMLPSHLFPGSGVSSESRD